MLYVHLKTSIRLISSLVIVSGLVACSSDDGPKHIDSLSFQIEEEARVAFNNSSSTCEDQDNCPSYIGSLITFKKETVSSYYGDQTSYRVSLCSQQLISHNQVLTNFHCIPSDLQYEGSNCLGRINLKFPKSRDHQAESLHCSKIIKLTKQHLSSRADSPDWAIIELETSAKRPPATVSTNGIAIGEKLTIFPNYFTQSSYNDIPVGHGKIKKVNCVSTMTNIFSSSYMHPKSPIIAATCDHQMIQGNSGSGLYREDNSLAALGSFALKEVSTQVSFSGSKHTVKNKIIGGTNLHCISSFNSTPSPFCEYTASPEMTVFNQFSSLLLAGAKSIANSPQSLYFDNRIIWSDESQIFYKQFGESKEQKTMLQSVPKIFTEYLFSAFYDIAKIKTPACVIPTADDSFALTIPFTSPDFEKAKLSLLGEITVEVKEDGFAVELNRSAANTAVYNLSLTRLAPSLRAEYQILKGDVEKAKKECKDTGALFSFYCDRAKQKTKILKAWKLSNSIDEKILRNEAIITEHTGVKNDITIPVCTAEQMN